MIKPCPTEKIRLAASYRFLLRTIADVCANVHDCFETIVPWCSGGYRRLAGGFASVAARKTAGRTPAPQDRSDLAAESANSSNQRRGISRRNARTLACMNRVRENLQPGH